MIVPDELTPQTAKEIGQYRQTKEALTMFCKSNFKVSPHAFRYAFITQASKRGFTPQMIAKMTQHSQLNMILKYTEQESADNGLRKGML